MDPDRKAPSRDEIPVAALIDEAAGRLEDGAGAKVAQTGQPEGLTVHGDRGAYLARLGR